MFFYFWYAKNYAYRKEKKQRPESENYNSELTLPEKKQEKHRGLKCDIAYNNYIYNLFETLKGGG